MPTPHRHPALSPSQFKSDSGKRYTILKELGYGFGKNVCQDQDGQLFVIKLLTNRTLKREVDVLTAAEQKQCHHFARLHDQGTFSGINLVSQPRPFIVMDYLGRNLEFLYSFVADARDKFPNGFTESTCLRVAVDTLNAIEELHYCGVISRDIKPENFVCGRGGFPNTGCMYIIDFDMSARYVNADGELLTIQNRNGIVGNIIYCSLAQHRCQKLGPIDDVESWFYSMLFLFNNGDLPWRKYSNMDRQKIYHAKLKMRKDKDIRCKLPEAMCSILKLIDGCIDPLYPPYDAIYRILEDIMHERHYSFSQLYDWETLPSLENNKTAVRFQHRK